MDRIKDVVKCHHSLRPNDSKKSSTYHFCILGGVGDLLKASSLISSMQSCLLLWDSHGFLYKQNSCWKVQCAAT